MFNRIVVGIDGTERGHDALVLAANLASATDAEVTLAHVYEPDVDDLPTGPDTGEAPRRAAEKLVTAAVRSGPPHARTAAIPGHRPAEDLCRFADQRGADLLVVGSSRRGTAGHVVLGDVSEAVVQAAPCAVAVAPSDYGARTGS